MGEKGKKGKQRAHSAAFKQAVVQRMEQGENVAGMCRELGIRRWLAYRWRRAYREGGPAELDRQRGRRRRPATEKEQNRAREAAEQIAELERKVGRQALQIDFLQRAFKRVEELRQKSTGTGGTASMERSGE